MNYTKRYTVKSRGKKKLSIAIPVYNERKTVGEVIEKVKSIKLPIGKEIIVVDDGSNDGSFEIIKKIKGIEILRHATNQGKGAAIKTALKYSTGDIFIVQDADLELNPQEISKIIKPILENKAEVVYGSRNPDIGKIDRHPLFYFGGILITKITNLLYKTKLTDEPCGYKAFKMSIIKKIEIKENRFGWEPEITAKISKKKIKICEVFINSKSRSAKEGKKLRASDGLEAIWLLIKYKFKD
nr:UDP-N-acetylglucosamine--dolichyl-phosphate N-acetylglucosaminyltransferase [uncultured archaeon]